MGNKEEKNNTVPNGSMEITGRRHKSARPGRISYVPISDEDLAPYEPPVRKKHKGLKITGIAVAMVIVSAGAAYAGMSYYYSDKFFEGTSINGIDCSGKTAYEAEQKLAKTVENYSIEVDSRNLDPQTISGDQLDEIKEVIRMTRLGQMLMDEGMEKGIELNQTDSIKKLMKNMNLTIDQAMNALEVPEDKREKYRKTITPDN